MLPTRALLANVLLAALLGAACAPKSPPGALTAARGARTDKRPARDAAERAVQLAAFDQAWQRIADTYPHADFRGLDWVGVKAELRPRAARCRTAHELRPVLTEMLSRLGESHFQVLPGDGSPAAATDPGGAVSRIAAPGEAAPAPTTRGDLGLEVRRLGSKFVVTRVDPSGPAAAAGIEMGWSLLAVGDTHARDVLRRAAAARQDSMLDYLSWAVMSAAMRGEPGSPVTVLATPPTAPTRTLQLVRRDPPGEVTRLGNLPDLVAELDARRLDGNVGYIRFTMFLVPVAEPFSAAIRDFVRDDARGVIIDLRGNPGGIGGLVMGMAGHFVREPGKSLGTMKTRQAELDFVANPRGKGSQFDGKVAVLVDGLSLSTSELFAAGLQQLGRARVFGQRTGGMALPSIIEALPNGDRLQFAVADLLAPGGRRIEGVGVRPDVEMPLLEDDLVAGRDATLEAALDWIRSGAGDPHE